MRITQGYLEQLEREAQRFDRDAAAWRNCGQADEADRLETEAKARRDRIARLRGDRTDGVRFG